LDPLAKQHNVLIEITGGTTPTPDRLRHVETAVAAALSGGAPNGDVNAEGLAFLWRPVGPGEQT
jgi:hypothetical protein